MRKILAVALAVLQLGFFAGMIGYEKTLERHLTTDAVEYEFAADGSFWAWGNERSLRLTIRQKGSVTRTDRYWEIVTGADGVSTVRRTDVKPLSGAYIDASGHSDAAFYAWLEKSVYVDRSFEETYFPGLKEKYCEECVKEYGGVPDDADDWYGTDDINDPAFGNTFTVKARVWKGSVTITDYLVNGESIKAYIRFVQETDDVDESVAPNGTS